MPDTGRTDHAREPERIEHKIARERREEAHRRQENERRPLPSPEASGSFEPLRRPKPGIPLEGSDPMSEPFDIRTVEDAREHPGEVRPIDPAPVRLEPLADAQTSEQAEHARRIAEKREEAPRRWRFFFALNLSLVVMAFSIVLFQSPQHFAFGGTSGLAIVLASAIPLLPMAGWMWVLNVLIVIIGFVFLPRRAVAWSAYASVALSVYTSLFSAVLPKESITGDMWLDLCLAVLLPAVSSAIAFDVGGSTGGTDILAMIVNRKTSIDIGKALSVVNFGVVVTTFLLYGTRVGLYCLLGLFGKTMVVDSIIESLHLRKVCTIVCKHPREIERFIIVELDRTATLTYAYGAYSGRRMAQVVSVLSRSEARRLLAYVHKEAPDAFVTIVNSSEIVGRGFRFVG